MNDQQKALVRENLGQALDRIDQKRLMGHIETIAQWERLSGSDDEKQAFDFIESELKELGWSTRRFNPVCLVSLPGSASILVNDQESIEPCITHSFSVSTQGEGITGELVYAGNGTDADYDGLDVAGKIVLVEGLATPNKVQPAERHNVAAVIHNSGEHIHEMTISPVWGSPTPDKFHLLPTIPHVSVGQESADRLKELSKAGPVKVRIQTRVDTGWRPLPVLVADLPASGPSDQHVLLSGHVDSWYYGAMDNGSANAAMLECARLLADNRSNLVRSIRLAFWSGHSHARYATSTWYADEFWFDLNERCVAHVNIDSPGGIGATNLTETNTMAETYPYAREIIHQLAGQELNYARAGRKADQSFWGTGVPSLYASISQQQPRDDKPDHLTALSGAGGRGGGLGWWWHTAFDTIDKIDPEFLERDTRILFTTVYRLGTEQLLPFDQTGVAEEILTTVRELQASAPEEIGLATLVEDAEAFADAARRLADRCRQPVDPGTAERLNECIRGISRALVPVNYTISGPFDHDPAMPVKPLPGLQPIKTLGNLKGDDNGYYGWIHKLRRERNRARSALRGATALADRALAGSDGR